jgi:hypothetical protein
VAERKAFLLRIDPTVLEALQRWANDDLRSLNGQIEFLLRQSLRSARRGRPRPSSAGEAADRTEVHEGGPPERVPEEP